jgi:hypothetical protein
MLILKVRYSFMLLKGSEQYIEEGGKEKPINEQELKYYPSRLSKWKDRAVITGSQQCIYYTRQVIILLYRHRIILSRCVCVGETQ